MRSSNPSSEPQSAWTRATRTLAELIPPRYPRRELAVFSAELAVFSAELAERPHAET